MELKRLLNTNEHRGLDSFGKYRNNYKREFKKLGRQKLKNMLNENGVRMVE